MNGAANMNGLLLYFLLSFFNCMYLHSFQELKVPFYIGSLTDLIASQNMGFANHLLLTIMPPRHHHFFQTTVRLINPTERAAEHKTKSLMAHYFQTS